MHEEGKQNTKTEVFLHKNVPEPLASIFIYTLAEQNMTRATGREKDDGLVVRQRRGKEDVFSLHSSHVLHGEKKWTLIINHRTESMLGN